MNKTKLRRLLNNMALSFIFTASIYLNTNAARAAFTAEDVPKAKGDVAALKRIAGDPETHAHVRFSAIQLMPDAKDQLSYLDTDLTKNDAYVRGQLLFLAIYHNQLPLARYPEAATTLISQGDAETLYWVQKAYVEKLLKQGNFAQALSESKRLMGLAALRGDILGECVQLIANCIKANEIKQGKSVNEAVQAMNSYLEAINAGDVSKIPYTTLAYPPAIPAVAAMEEDDNARVAAVALLYNGKYDAAKDKATVLVALSTQAEELQRAIALTGMALNGKSGLPTAANAVLGNSDKR